MALEKFTLSSLSTIDDGRIRVAFEQALKRCEDDCKDRPNLKEPRKIALLVVIEPVSDDNGNLDSCRVQFHLTDAQPKRRSKVYDMKAARGGLLFNELSADDVHQMTLDMSPGPKSTARNLEGSDDDVARGKDVANAR